MQQKLIDLSTQYLQAGNAIHDAIRDIIKDEGGFINASNNKQVKTDIKALVFNSKTGYSETFPIRGLRVNEKGDVEVFVGIFGTIYTDKYLRGSASEERWRPLKGSNCNMKGRCRNGSALSLHLNNLASRTEWR